MSKTSSSKKNGLKNDDPPYLTVGTEVSAKFKGAFCEAKIDQVTRELKIKVVLKESPFGSVTVSDRDFPNARFEINEHTDVILQKKTVRCVIHEIKDISKYHVVFDDGDEKELRRTQMVLKGGKHFAADGNLDAMPLTNPESFSSPVIRATGRRGAPRGRNMEKVVEPEPEEEDEEDNERESTSKPREKRRAANAAVAAIGELNQAQGLDTQSDESGADSSEEKERAKERRKKREEEKGAGPSTSTRASSIADDPEPSISSRKGSTEPSSSTTSNGVLSAKEEKARAAKEQKQKEKEEKRRQKDLEKEKERQQKRAEKEERSKQRGLEKERKKEQKLMKAAREAEKLKFLTATKRNRKLHKKRMSFELQHPSVRYRMRINVMKAMRERKPEVVEEDDEIVTWRRRTNPMPPSYIRVRIRNHLLLKGWRFKVQTLRKRRYLRKCAYFRLQWKRKKRRDLPVIYKSASIFKKKECFHRLSKWFNRIEKHKSLQIVIYHESARLARKLIKYVEKDMDEQTFAERLSIKGDDIITDTLSDHFHDTEWYPAILFPDVFPDPNGSEFRQRIIRNMGNGKLVRVWEDDLLPSDWVPRFGRDTVSTIIDSRRGSRRGSFKLAWNMARHLDDREIDLKFIRARLRNANLIHMYLTGNRRCERPLNLSAVPPVLVAPPVRRSETIGGLGEGGAADSDYDSDADIKNSMESERDAFTAALIAHFDLTQNQLIVADPPVQGYDVNLYYFYRLVQKMGGAKKFINGKYWSKAAKKLIPKAVNPEIELRTVFSTYLESFMKSQHVMPTGERTMVVPGVYSEAKRKRKSEKETSASLPTTSSMTPGRHPSSSVETVDRHPRKSKSRLSTSRESRPRTVDSDGEPGPSHRQGTSRVGLLNSDSEGEAEEVLSNYAGSERRESVTRKIGRPKRGSMSTTPSRSIRSNSNRVDEEFVVAPPKKGRPRKHVAPLMSPPATLHGKQAGAKEETWENYIAANIISRFLPSQTPGPAQTIGCFNGGLWWTSSVVSERVPDFAEDLLKVMLTEQYNYSLQDHLSSLTEDMCEKAMRRKYVTVHYVGWNDRYNEMMPMPRVLVTKEEQAKARRRFLLLPRGKELLPETLAKFEYTYQNWYDEEDDRPPLSAEDEAVMRGAKRHYTREQFLQWAIEALRPEGYEPVQRAQVAQGALRRPHKEDEDSSGEEGEEGVRSGVDKEVKEESDEEERPQDSSSTDEMREDPQPREEDVAMEEKDEGDVEEEGKDDQDEYDLEMIVDREDAPKEESEEPMELDSDKEKEQPDQTPEYDRGSEYANAMEGDLEEESDEPVYTHGSRGEELSSAVPPTLNTIPSIQSTSSADSIPCLTPQDSVSSSMGSPLPTEPTILPQTPANLLAYSGPLTLDEVQPAMPPASATSAKQEERHGDDDEEHEEREAVEKRRTSEVGGPPVKRSRRVSEIDAFGETSPLLTMPRRDTSSPITSGALTLDIPLQTESSGPIEPLAGSGKKGSRKKTSTPVFQKPSPSMVTSGPLTLSPTKGRPPGASPLGRPKKKVSAEPLSTVSKPQKRSEDGIAIPVDELKEAIPKNDKEDLASIESSSTKESSTGSRAATSGSTTPAAVEEEKEDEEPSDEPDQPAEAQTTPRGSTGSARGKKRRGGGRVGGSFGPKPAKNARKKEDNGDEDKQTQKNRFIRQFECGEVEKDFSLLGLPDINELIAAAPPGDINLILEERTNELRELFHQNKSDCMQLERRYRLQVERRKAHDAQLAAGNSSSSNN